MRGVLLKILHETWLGTLLFTLALFLVEVVLNLVLPEFFDQMDDILARLPFIRDFISAMLGVDIEGEVTAQLMQAFVWVHPTVLSLLWAQETMFCTRYPAGEIDRGTIDVLLALPVSRRSVYLAETIGWLSSGVLVLAGGAIGYAVGSQAIPLEYRPEFSSVLLVVFNLFCLYVAVGGFAFMISSLSERRGRAVFTVFATVLASFLVNFLAQFWALAKPLGSLSVLQYYQPATILKTGRLVPLDIAVLLIAGAVFWVVGCEYTARRSICTT